MPEADSTKPAHHTIDCHDVVHAVEFFPHEWDSALIAIGTSSCVSVGTCRFQAESNDVEGFEFSLLKEFNHGVRVSAISWSPLTSLSTVPKLLRFCTSGSDKKIRVISSDMKDTDTIMMIEGHTDYINDVTFDPDKGDHLASVSDDHTCKIWGVGQDKETDATQEVSFPLRSPGVSVRWHSKDTLKVMVAEKRGVILFFNLINQQPIMSLDCGQSPLLTADWCHSDIIHAAAVCNSEIFFFDTSRSSQPIESRPIQGERGQEVRWCKSHSHMVACVGSPGAQLRVITTRTNQNLLSVDLPFASGLSWHSHLPVLGMGSDRHVHLWFIDPQ